MQKIDFLINTRYETSKNYVYIKRGYTSCFANWFHRISTFMDYLMPKTFL